MPFIKARFIGKGAFGRVYVAYYGGHVYAIKRCLKKSQAASREAHMLQLCRGLPHVAQLATTPLYTETPSGLIVQNLIFPYMHGTLEDLIKLSVLNRIPIPLDVIRDIVSQVLLGVTHLHARNIVHRDLKPQNILLQYSCTSGTRQVTAYICDLGSSKQMEKNNDKTCNTPYVTSLYYRAPELLLGCVDYGSPVDMWALGCIIGELLIGRPLFTGGTLRESSFLHLKDLPNMKMFDVSREGSKEACQLITLLSELGSPDRNEIQRLVDICHPRTRTSACVVLTAAYELLRNQRSMRDILSNAFHQHAKLTQCGCHRFSDKKGAELWPVMSCTMLAWADCVSHILRWAPNDRLTAEQMLRLPLFG